MVIRMMKKIKAIILLAILVLSTLSPAMAYNVGDNVNETDYNHIGIYPDLILPGMHIRDFNLWHAIWVIIRGKPIYPL
jgi:hypothetical protein